MIELLRKYGSDVDEQSMSHRAPLAIVPCGYPNHGKTTLLASLFYLLDKLPRRLLGFTLEPADTYTRTNLSHFVENFKSRNLEHGTRPEAIPPFVVAANRLPAAGQPGSTQDRLLAFFDVAGEAARAGSSFERLLSEPLPHCHVPWLIFNLSGTEPRETLSSLLQNYIHLVRQAGSTRSLEGKRLIIVYTCCDLLLEHLPADVKAYLQEDPDFNPTAIDAGPLRAFDFGAYMARAERISKSLEQFTESKIQDGASLLSLARSYEIEIRFCATSSTGHVAANGEMYADPTPKRVLDPLFWALYERPEDPPSHEAIQLMIQGDCYADLVKRNMLTPLLQELKRFHPFAVYYLGRTRPERLPEATDIQLKPPAQSHPSLIMPVLEQSSPVKAGRGRVTKTVVLTRSRVHDGHDAMRSRFGEAIQWIVTDEELCSEFDNVVYLSGPEDVQSTIRHVVANLKQM